MAVFFTGAFSEYQYAAKLKPAAPFSPVNNIPKFGVAAFSYNNKLQAMPNPIPPINAVVQPAPHECLSLSPAKKKGRRENWYEPYAPIAAAAGMLTQYNNAEIAGAIAVLPNITYPLIILCTHHTSKPIICKTIAAEVGGNKDGYL